MPCNTIQRSTVSLELKAENRTLLIAALKSLGYIVSERDDFIAFSKGTVSGSFRNGKLTLNGERFTVERFDVNEVKRAYSREVIMTATKRFGWATTQDKQNENKFVVQRRS